MSECMIVRRGGRSGGGSFDPNGAVLKVITSTNCTILVTGTGYSETHQQADGFPRSGDANVTEHFFSIPASAFGTITVKATNTYGDNTKTITVNTAGKVYEVLVSAPNIILNSTFGLQEGFLNKLNLAIGVYSERYKRLQRTDSSTNSGFHGNIADIPVGPYSTLQITAEAWGQNATISLEDQDSVALCNLGFTASSSTKTATLNNKYYPYATLKFYSFGFDYVTEIVLT